MPKSLADWNKMEEVPSDRAGGKKINGKDIATQINASGLAYSVKEVHETLCDKKVTSFRVHSALDQLAEKGELKRMWDGKKYWYGPKDKVPDQPAQPPVPEVAQ